MDAKLFRVRRRTFLGVNSAVTLALPRAVRAQPATPLVMRFTLEGARGMRRGGEGFTAATGVPVIVETPGPAEGPFRVQRSSATDKGPDIYIDAHDRISEWVAAGHVLTP